MSGSGGKNNSPTGLGIGLLTGGFMVLIIAAAVNAPGIIIIAILMIVVGSVIAAVSAANKSKNGNNPNKPPYSSDDPRNPYWQNRQDGADPRTYNPWQNQNNGLWGPYPNKPENNGAHKQGGQTRQPEQSAKAAAGQALKAEEIVRIKEENGTGTFENAAADAAASKEDETLFDIERDDDGAAAPANVILPGTADEAGLENLEFEANAERENLAILQSCGPMETGRITATESLSANYCRITFEVRTSEGAFTRYAIVKKDAKFTPDSAHYILLDKDNEDRCTVL